MARASNPSRRSFVLNTVLLTGAMIGGTGFFPIAVSAKGIYKENSDEDIKSDESTPNTLPYRGLLYSQVGYPLGQKARIVLRMPHKDSISNDAIAKLNPVGTENRYKSACSYWGLIWKSHWWICEFDDIEEEGEWSILITDKGEKIFTAEGFRVSKDVLWEQTYDLSSVDMLERRKHFTKVGAGWQDAGALWVESPAQSAMIICLTDLASFKHHTVTETFLRRVFEQITVGADYLVMTQQKAIEMGKEAGAMCHDLLGHEDAILPNDVAKAVVALYKSARVLPPRYEQKKKQYIDAADLSIEWLLTKAKPMGSVGFGKRQRGLPESIKVPENEWLTRDMIFICWSALERTKNGDAAYKQICIEWANAIMERQISQGDEEVGFYGHFREFQSLPHSQNLWVHSIMGGEYGADAGGLFPNYLEPFFEMLNLWPEHSEAVRWKKTLKNYAYGFLIPACKKNPFYLVPNGIFGEEGAIWFAGPFHGTNTIYGYSAAIAARLFVLFPEPFLKDIAIGNLQWIAGLNAGVTKASLSGSVIYSEDIPEHLALPSSMICGVGNRTAGTWFQTRGVVCNGFSVGEQFKMEINPSPDNDGPFSFTDEDWIPHSAGFLTGLMRLAKI